MSARSTVAWWVFLATITLLGTGMPSNAGNGDASPVTPADSATNDNANPYLVIVERNAFRLNSPPSPPPPNQGLPPVLPQVYLSGFMQTGDKVNVLLVVMTQNPDPHGHDLTSYLTLAEGDKRTVGSGTKAGTIELVKAYASQGKADIINTGTPVTLTMADNGFKGLAAVPISRNKMMAFHTTPAAEAPVSADDPAAEAAPSPGDHPSGSAAPAQ